MFYHCLVNATTLAATDCDDEQTSPKGRRSGRSGFDTVSTRDCILQSFATATPFADTATWVSSLTVHLVINGITSASYCIVSALPQFCSPISSRYSVNDFSMLSAVTRHPQDVFPIWSDTTHWVKSPRGVDLSWSHRPRFRLNNDWGVRMSSA